jgi:thiol:disulfide interchange protein
MEKLKNFFTNTHVITSISVLLVIAVIWLLLYLLISYPVGFIAICIVLVALTVLGYFTFQLYRVILGFVEEYKESRK